MGKKRLALFRERKIFIQKTLEKQIEELDGKILFIKLVRENKLILLDPEEKILKTMKEHLLPEKLLLIPVKTLNRQNVDLLIRQRNKLAEELKKITSKSAVDLWIADLEELKGALGKLDFA